jgi:hypothetical protein
MPMPDESSQPATIQDRLKRGGVLGLVYVAVIWMVQTIFQLIISQLVGPLIFRLFNITSIGSLNYWINSQSVSLALAILVAAFLAVWQINQTKDKAEIRCKKKVDEWVERCRILNEQLHCNNIEKQQRRMGIEPHEVIRTVKAYMATDITTPEEIKYNDIQEKLREYDAKK